MIISFIVNLVFKTATSSDRNFSHDG